MPLERSRGVSMIDVIDRVLDKGIVIDYWARVSLLGVDLLTGIDARIIVASIDTYVQYAEQIGRTGALARLLPPGVDVNAARSRSDTASRRRPAGLRPNGTGDVINHKPSRPARHRPR